MEGQHKHNLGGRGNVIRRRTRGYYSPPPESPKEGIEKSRRERKGASRQAITQIGKERRKAENT